MMNISCDFANFSSVFRVIGSVIVKFNKWLVTDIEIRQNYGRYIVMKGRCAWHLNGDNTLTIECIVSAMRLLVLLLNRAISDQILQLQLALHLRHECCGCRYTLASPLAQAQVDWAAWSECSRASRSWVPERCPMQNSA